MNKTITEYTITFEDIDEEDFITEDKQEADAKIEELKENGEFYKVYQYYAKDWVYNDETGDWEESDVEVYYTKGEDEELEESSEIPMYIDEYYPTRQEAKAAEKVLKQQGRKTKVERHGNEYIVWTSYEKVEEDINQGDKIEYNIYTISGGDGVYNSHKVDTVETEEQAIDRVSELKAETGNGAYYTKVVNGKELDEAKSLNNEFEIEYATPNYTGGNVYVFTGKLKNGNYFLADDTFTPFDTRILDIDPNTTIKDENGIEVTLMDDVSLQDKHLVKDLDENDAKEFTLNLVKWIEENKPDGNYQVDEIKAKLDNMYKMEEKKSNGIFDEKDVKSYISDIAKVVADVVSNSAKSANVEVPNKGKLMNNNSVIVYELPIKFTGDMIGLGDEIAKQLYSNLESGRVKEVKCIPTHTKNGQVLTLSIIGPDIVSKNESKKLNEEPEVDNKTSDEKEEIEQQEEIIDTENELEEGIKKEVYQYAKQQGLDIEKLRKQGIELETLEETLDTVIGNMVSKSAIEYMDKTGKDITWDFEVSGNDIKIIWNEV